MNKWFLLIAIVLTGCASTHEVVTNAMQSTIAASEDSVHFKDNLIKIPKGKSAYLAYSNDGYDQVKSYPQSGQQAMGVLNKAFAPYFSKLICAKSYQSAQSEYLYAREKNYAYFILPRVTHWTDSYTLLTGVADEVAMNLKIYDLRTNQLVDEITFSSVSSKMPGYEKTPMELIQSALQDITNHLFM